MGERVVGCWGLSDLLASVDFEDKRIMPRSHVHPSDSLMSFPCDAFCIDRSTGF